MDWLPEQWSRLREHEEWFAWIGAASLAFGRWVGVRGPRYIGAILVQAAPALWLVVAPVSPLVVATALVLQAVAVAAVARRVATDPSAPISSMTAREASASAASERMRLALEIIPCSNSFCAVKSWSFMPPRTSRRISAVLAASSNRK